MKIHCKVMKACVLFALLLMVHGCTKDLGACAICSEPATKTYKYKGEIEITIETEGSTIVLSPNEQVHVCDSHYSTLQIAVS